MGPKLADYLKTREGELEAQISNLRGHLAPLETELAEVRRIRSLIADCRAAGNTDLASDAILPRPPASGLETAAKSQLSEVSPKDAPKSALSTLNQNVNEELFRASALTIKQMIIGALRDHFHFHGATPTELSEYMKAAYGREVDRNSISPQLARLRDEGMVEQPTGLLNEGRWQLTRRGRWYGDAKNTIAGGAGLDE